LKTCTRPVNLSGFVDSSVKSLERRRSTTARWAILSSSADQQNEDIRRVIGRSVVPSNRTLSDDPERWGYSMLLRTKSIFGILVGAFFSPNAFAYVVGYDTSVPISAPMPAVNAPFVDPHQQGVEQLRTEPRAVDFRVARDATREAPRRELTEEQRSDARKDQARRRGASCSTSC
jgi:hypothetical protein